MRMKAEHVSRLQELMDLPHLTRRTKLILARRIARHLSNERNWARFQLKREVAQTVVTPANFDAMPINRRRNAGWDTYNLSLAAIGTWVSQNEGPMTEDYGFDGICDLLNVNPVHRTYMRRLGK